MIHAVLPRAKRHRKPVSKRVRFEVFKRDAFTCHYCGATPPKAVLEVDHIEPVSLGGTNDEWNLLTACFDCNRGKSNRPLSVAPMSLSERKARTIEAEEQIKAYRAVMAEVAARQEADIWAVVEALFGTPETTVARYDSIKRFLGELNIHDVIEAADIARSKFSGSTGRRFAYFCGVCWHKIGGIENGTH